MPKPHARKTAAKRRAVPRPRRPVAAAPAPARVGALTGAAEDLEDLFDESIRHALAEIGRPEWGSSPVVALPLGATDAGTLGWRATVSRGGMPVGTVVLLLLPTPSSGPVRAPRTLPLADRSWEEFLTVDHDAGPPRTLLLGELASPEESEPFRRFARTVAAHLHDELH
ncbi:MAG TPA: hypothetical protein VLX64_00980 [Thermoplasmata archaeon]|nr:hypothetical protein [Thermoplasmata archaeon]